MVFPGSFSSHLMGCSETQNLLFQIYMVQLWKSWETCSSNLSACYIGCRFNFLWDYVVFKQKEQFLVEDLSTWKTNLCKMNKKCISISMWKFSEPRWLNPAPLPGRFYSIYPRIWELLLHGELQVARSTPFQLFPLQISILQTKKWWDYILQR